MPIWLRRFTFQNIQEYYKKQNEETEQQQAELKRQSSKINMPNYRTKAPKK